jgi:hypothetical protein
VACLAASSERRWRSWVVGFPTVAITLIVGSVKKECKGFATYGQG